MLELCMSGQVFKIFLLSSLAQIMKAFIGLCKPIFYSLLLPRVHCLIKIRDQSGMYLDMWSSVSLSFWLSDNLGAIFAWGGNMFNFGGLSSWKTEYCNQSETNLPPSSSLPGFCSYLDTGCTFTFRSYAIKMK